MNEFIALIDWWWPLLPVIAFVWAPKSWIPGELVSAAALNTNIRDHLNESLRTQATALTGTQNNLALDGPFAYLKCNNASALTITGALIDGGNVDGAKIIIDALNSTVTLKDQDAGSTTSNRIITATGGDLLIATPERLLLVYDGTAERWRTGATLREHDKIGIGTPTIPHGAVGMGLLAVEGPDSSASGPHAQITTDSDDYPLFQMYMWAHDTMALLFDAYYQSGWKSSDAGSNFIIHKYQDILRFKTDSGIAQGGAITWLEAIAITKEGTVGIGTVSVDTSAKLEILSTTGALLLPRMTNAQRNALTAVNGMMIYNTTNTRIEAYENGAWGDISA